jgi:hypothetical protein
MPTELSSKFPSIETAVFAAQHEADVSTKFSAERSTNEATFVAANCAALYPAVSSTELQALDPAF